MATNFKRKGTVFTHALAADASAGDVIVTGTAVGIAETTGLTGEEIEVNRCGVYALTKKAGLAITQGDLLWWDATPGEITKTAADGVFIGQADSDAAGGDAEVEVFLVPMTPDIAANAGADPGLTYSLSYAAPVSTPHTPLSTSDTYTDAAVNAELAAIEAGYEAVEAELINLAADVAENAVDIAAIRTALLNAGLLV